MTNKLDKIRIGNDINVLPELTAGGEPVTWRDDVAKVIAFSVAQRQGVELETSVVDGVLEAIFRAEQQRWLGIYHVVVVLKDGNTATWDKPAFELVATTADADVESGMAVVKIQGELTVVTGGTGVWGRILGDILNQQDLIELIESRQYDDTELREAVQEAMRLIDTKASAEVLYPAFDYVAGVGFDGVDGFDQGDWYLPSTYELADIIRDVTYPAIYEDGAQVNVARADADVVNRALNAIGGTAISNGSNTWSSCRYLSYGAWFFYGGVGFGNYNLYCYRYTSIPCVLYKLNS